MFIIDRVRAICKGHSDIGEDKNVDDLPPLSDTTVVNIEGGVKLSSTLVHLHGTHIPGMVIIVTFTIMLYFETCFSIVTIFMKIWLLLSRVVITVTNLYISLVDIIMIIITAIITIDLHMWLVFNIIMSCFHHHHSIHGNHRQPVHVT